MKGLFTKHPHTMGETYWGHMAAAGFFGGKMLICGFACLTHAVFPFLFKETGSNLLYEMIHNFIDRCPKAEKRMQQLANTLNEKIDCEEIE